MVLCLSRSGSLSLLVHLCHRRGLSGVPGFAAILLDGHLVETHGKEHESACKCPMCFELLVILN